MKTLSLALVLCSGLSTLGLAGCQTVQEDGYYEPSYSSVEYGTGYVYGSDYGYREHVRRPPPPRYVVDRPRPPVRDYRYDDRRPPQTWGGGGGRQPPVVVGPRPQPVGPRPQPVGPVHRPQPTMPGQRPFMPETPQHMDVGR